MITKSCFTAFTSVTCWKCYKVLESILYETIHSAKWRLRYVQRKFKFKAVHCDFEDLSFITNKADQNNKDLKFNILDNILQNTQTNRSQLRIFSIWDNLAQSLMAVLYCG